MDSVSWREEAGFLRKKLKKKFQAYKYTNENTNTNVKRAGINQ